MKSNPTTAFAIALALAAGPSFGCGDDGAAGPDAGPTPD